MIPQHLVYTYCKSGEVTTHADVETVNLALPAFGTASDHREGCSRRVINVWRRRKHVLFGAEAYCSRNQPEGGTCGSNTRLGTHLHGNRGLFTPCHVHLDYRDIVCVSDHEDVRVAGNVELGRDRDEARLSDGLGGERGDQLAALRPVSSGDKKVIGCDRRSPPVSKCKIPITVRRLTFDFAMFLGLKSFLARKRTRGTALEPADTLAKDDFDSHTLELALKTLAKPGLVRSADEIIARVDERDCLFVFEMRSHLSSVFNLKQRRKTIRQQHFIVAPFV
jgi:hypothetical protein